MYPGFFYQVMKAEYIYTTCCVHYRWTEYEHSYSIYLSIIIPVVVVRYHCHQQVEQGRCHLLISATILVHLMCSMSEMDMFLSREVAGSFWHKYPHSQEICVLTRFNTSSHRGSILLTETAIDSTVGVPSSNALLSGSRTDCMHIILGVFHSSI